ncbi:hypothetical protein SAY87_002746 [Trapa incisa]|uniref:Uncharacterized protein n=1 Tax=Trapa incisa TaxID=236973 RepID=A0AAN7JWN4_9MYRT|nr:hypothetical protein SAY87_002746 [Trapa incisa]
MWNDAVDDTTKEKLAPFTALTGDESYQSHDLEKFIPEKFIKTLKLTEHRYEAKDFEQGLQPSHSRHILPHRGRYHVEKILLKEAQGSSLRKWGATGLIAQRTRARGYEPGFKSLIGNHDRDSRPKAMELGCGCFVEME